MTSSEKWITKLKHGSGTLWCVSKWGIGGGCKVRWEQEICGIMYVYNSEQMLGVDARVVVNQI